MPIFLSIGQIARELELPPLNMNAKQSSLYGTTLSDFEQSFLAKSFKYHCIIHFTS